MTTATLATPGAAAPVLPHPPGGLALALQEAFTVAARLRTRRQAVPDANSFRQRIKQLVGAADEEARREGYAPEYVRLAVYAYIAFLDESVLNSGLPVFSDWPRQPLQEEIFGDHMAGETFFKFLQDLLARQDSPDLADLLEVFQLCMLLGYRGKYSAGGQGGLQGLILSTQEKILRIRGGRSELSPAWRPPQEVIPTTRDPWVRRLVIITLCTLGVALVLFVVFKIVLHTGVADIEALAAKLGA
jgi:type VI secretion system protein ImpK